MPKEASLSYHLASFILLSKCKAMQRAHMHAPTWNESRFGPIRMIYQYISPLEVLAISVRIVKSIGIWYSSLVLYPVAYPLVPFDYLSVFPGWMGINTNFVAEITFVDEIHARLSSHVNGSHSSHVVHLFVQWDVFTPTLVLICKSSPRLSTDDRWIKNDQKPTLSWCCSAPEKTITRVTGPVRLLVECPEL